MSLEGKIAELVTATNGLITTFTNKKKEIDSAVSTAVAAVPNMLRTWYVDAIAGVDDNPGTGALPLRTIEKALAATPVGGIADVRLMSDYEVKNPISVIGRLLRISGHGSGRQLIHRYYLPEGRDVSELAGFSCAMGANIEFVNFDLVFPSSSGVVPPPTKGGTSIVSSVYTNGSSLLGLRLDRIKFIFPDDFVGYLMASAVSSAIVLQSIRSDFPINFSGHFIHPVSSGTESSTLSNVLTNIAKL